MKSIFRYNQHHLTTLHLEKLQKCKPESQPIEKIPLEKVVAGLKEHNAKTPKLYLLLKIIK